MRSKMLLKMAVNATKCSTFEVQCGKSTSTAIRHFKATLTDHVISRMRMRSNSSTAFNSAVRYDVIGS